MVNDRAALDREIDRNLEAFRRLLPGLLDKHRNKYALLHRQEVVEAFDTVRDAAIVGELLYPDGLFSIQKVVSDPVDLGFFSHAVHIR